MGRIQRTWELAKASWRVLQADRELLLLPVISGVATLLTAATFLVPLTAAGGTGLEGPGSYAVVFGLYVSLAFITILFNTALVHAADERLRGGDPTVGTALNGAARHLGTILGWALISATVSLILRAIEQRGGGVGRIVSGLAGVAWSLVTFLVIPTFVVEEVGVVEAVKRSASLFRRTWGENVAARVGFGLLGFLAAMPAAGVIALGVSAGGALAVAALVVGVLWIALVTVVLSALNAIFQTALYHYAVSGGVPGGFFPASTLQGAFGPRHSRGLLG